MPTLLNTLYKLYGVFFLLFVNSWGKEKSEKEDKRQHQAVACMYLDAF